MLIGEDAILQFIQDHDDRITHGQAQLIKGCTVVYIDTEQETELYNDLCDIDISSTGIGSKITFIGDLPSDSCFCECLVKYQEFRYNMGTLVISGKRYGDKPSYKVYIK